MKGKFIEYLLVAIFVAIFFPLYVIYVGFVLRELWSMFLVPLGIMEVTIGGAIGVSLLFLVFKGYSYVPEDKDNKAQIYQILFSPLISYLIGLFVYHYFI